VGLYGVICLLLGGGLVVGLYDVIFYLLGGGLVVDLYGVMFTFWEVVWWWVYMV
jgi:hypothetical protein